MLEPLKRPVVVRALGKRYRLTPARAEVGVDIDGSVHAALERSRDGSVLTRTWRGIRGKPVGAELDLDITYSKAAIARLVTRVSKAVDEPAVDASVDLENGDVAPQASKEGRRLLARKLKRQVRRSLLDTGDDKTVLARTEVVKPKVTTEELAAEYPAILVVNRSAFQLTLYKDLKLVKTYGIAVGQVGLETPGRALPHPEQGREPRLDACPTPTGRAAWPARSSPAARPRTRSRRAGSASSTAPASTGPTPRARSAPPRRTAASGC